MNAEPVPGPMVSPAVPPPEPEKEDALEPPITFGERWLGAVPLFASALCIAIYIQLGSAKTQPFECELLDQQVLGFISVPLIKIYAPISFTFGPLLFSACWIYFSIICRSRVRIALYSTVMWWSSSLLLFWPLAYGWSALNSYSLRGRKLENLPPVYERISGSLALFLLLFLQLLLQPYIAYIWKNSGLNPPLSRFYDYFNPVGTLLLFVHAALLLTYAFYLSRNSRRIWNTGVSVIVMIMAISASLAYLYAASVENSWQ